MQTIHRHSIRFVLLSLLLLSVTSWVSAATITENFGKLNAPTANDADGSFTGQGGVRWTYESVRKVTGKISGNSAELDRNGRGKLTATRSNGLSTLRFKIRTIDGRWHTTAKVRIWINGSSYGVRNPQQTDVPKTITISGIDLNGSVTVQLQSVGSLEAIIDDIVWESGGTPPPTGGGNDLAIDNNGWSILTPSSDTRKIYCSDSQGNDSNSGLSSSSPVKTLDKAFSLLRNGYPDHVYLKRGDVWTNQNFSGLGDRSGRSGSERLVVSYYGSGNRPLVRTNNTHILNTSDLFHAAIVGIEFYNYTADPTNSAFVNPGRNGVKTGFRFVTSFAENLLFEDCKLSFYSELISFFFKSENRGDVYKNIDIRRNILVNAYQRGATDEKIKSQGIFVSHTKDFLLEENFFDHNGWNESLSDAQPNQFNHNAYFSLDNAGPMIVRGNVFSRAAAHGLQLRSGGTAEYNAFIGNAIGMNMGYKQGPPTYYTGPTRVRHNVVTDGRPQIPNDNSWPQTGAVWGFYMEKINYITVSNNIVANIQDPRGINMRPYNQMDANEFGSGNIGWNWHQLNVPSSNPGWRNPNRDKESYARSKGYNGYNAWVAAARNRPLRNWPRKFTGREYVNYIKGGFTVVNASRAGSSTDQLAEVHSVRVYPNPVANGPLTVECQTPPRTIHLLDMTGRVVREVRQTNYRTTVNVAGLPGGIYLVQVEHPEWQTRRRIVID
jgi:hypothetical protein